MSSSPAAVAPTPLKQPHDLSPRIRRLREFYFEGTRRPWNNQFSCWTTGAPWDVLYDETSYYIVPETYAFFAQFRASALQAARPLPLPRRFWRWDLTGRRAWFIREVMVNRVPQELLPGDLIAGARFNLLASRCWTRHEARAWTRAVDGKAGTRAAVKQFHDHGYGNAGATAGHLIPDHPRALRLGWKGIHDDIRRRYDGLGPSEKRSPRGAQLRAMRTAATTARDLAFRYRAVCLQSADEAPDPTRADELRQMAANLARVPWQPATTFWEAMPALWINHMLVMSDENYPGPGVSFGRMDQYLWPYWQESLRRGMDRELGKEILRCFWVHANTAYDAMIRIGGNQGITSGFGQLVTLSGLGPGGRDLTNDLTYAILEVIDEMSPILEPKPNVRLHRGSTEPLLDTIVAMVAGSQGSPFLLNFDERSMAGMLREAAKADCRDLINESNVHDYAPVGCLENTMAGNDRSGTVDCNLNLLKAVELALTGGEDLMAPLDSVTGETRPVRRDGVPTGDAPSGLLPAGRFHATAGVIRLLRSPYAAEAVDSSNTLPRPTRRDPQRHPARPSPPTRCHLRRRK